MGRILTHHSLGVHLGDLPGHVHGCASVFGVGDELVRGLKPSERGFVSQDTLLRGQSKPQLKIGKRA